MNDLTAPILIESDGECSSAIERLGAIARDLSRIETTKATLVAAAVLTAEGEATPLLTEKATLEAAVTAWCTDQRARLTGKLTTKTIAFPSGSVNWRQGVETVEIDEGRLPKILKAIRRLGEQFEDRFIKVTESVRKRAIKEATKPERAKLARIKGIDFVPAEESFTITPAGAELAARP